ncbi:MAG: endonuclease/exonuclease/phosphatase family protein [Parvularculaceae bacterium]
MAALIAGSVLFRGVWPFEAAASALTQLALLAVMVAVLSLLLWRPVSASVLIAAAAFAFWRTAEAVAPPSPPVTNPDITVVWANLYNRPRSLSAVQALALRESADILAIAEYPAKDYLTPEFLAAYPHRYPERRSKGQNSVVFSRTAFLSATELPAKRHPPIRLTSIIDGAELTIIAVHPPVPFTPKALARQRDEIAVAFRAAPRGESYIIIGDFNAVPWNSVLTGPTIGLEAPKRLSLGARATWLSPLPLIGAPIDHAFISNDLVGAVRLGPANGSDHLPLIVNIKLDGAASHASLAAS